MTRSEMVRRLCLLYRCKVLKPVKFEQLIWLLNNRVDPYRVLCYTIELY